MNVALAAGFLAAAAAGTLLRWKAASAWNRASLPVGTFVVNLFGSFALGLLAGSNSTVLLLVGVGALGSLTTFSTLALETLELWRRKRARAVIYLCFTFTAGVASAYAGLKIAEVL